VDIYVYDNNSTDHTVEIARKAGAIVRHERKQGKGNVVRRMFSDIDADVYLLIDGDGTYDIRSAGTMIALMLKGGLDMVAGARMEQDLAAYRVGHRFGNKLFTGFVYLTFGSTLSDILSGYRVLSRRFVKSFPLLSRGFEIETELTIHALELDMPVAELLTPYSSRPAGSLSKLNTWKDGFRILWTIARLYKSERPLAFFSTAAALMAISAIGLSIPLLITYAESGTVPRLPTALLSTGMMIVSSLLVTCGLVLGTVTRGRREVKRLAYLQQRCLNLADYSDMSLRSFQDIEATTSR
jgi:glycosyltransferase involved in cell wall biosynthesis